MVHSASKQFFVVVQNSFRALGRQRGYATMTQEEKLQVKTKIGVVQGFITRGKNDSDVATFHGIPYAEPPIADLRFQPPKPVKPWPDTFKAVEYPSPCPQIVKQTPGSSRFSTLLTQPNEDCLKLNVWAPMESNERVPVMVFIHGGGFLEGSSLNGNIDGRHLSAREKVIVVTMNYRLGPLGFMYLGPDTASEVPGNAGLLDQQLALKWIKDNIGAFGGDPSNITVFGCSAGASSVGLHLLSPGSKGLFNRAIMMSGSPANPRVVRKKQVLLNAVCNLLEYVGYSGNLEDAPKVLDFLRTVDHKTLSIAGQHGTTGILDMNHFGPTMDGTFLPRSPVESLKTMKFENNVDLLIGNVSDEAISFFKAYFPGFFKKGDNLELTYDEHLDVIAKLNNRGLNENQIKWASSHYWYLQKNRMHHKACYSSMLRDTALDIVSDALYNSDVEQFAESYSKAGNRVYRYVFDQKLPFFKFPEYSGAMHVSDQMSILGSHDDILPEQISAFGDQMASRWANFARCGDPNLNTDLFKWPLYNNSTRDYALLKANQYQVLQSYRVNQLYFWNCILPNLVEKHHREKEKMSA